MKTFIPTAVLALCGIAFAPVVAAQQSGWYGGAAAGASHMDLSTRDWNDGTLSEKELNNDAAAYKVMAGYHFTPYLSAELSYVHFGDTKFSGYEPGTTPSIWQAGKVFGRAEAKGASLTGVASWPVGGRFAVFASGGVLMWNTTMLSNPTLSGGTLALSDQQVIHDSGFRFIYGAGAELRVYRQWHVRAAWEHATVRFAGTMDRGVDFPSLGVTLDF